ncbi:MAG TPA: MBOAT family O-acyltransferase [Bryobacteraceae bacterium]|nr:MBOAT family O-acyltransferase [Bryobacteraceae bacterium]
MHSTSAAYFLFLVIVLLAYWSAAGVRLARLIVLLAADYLFCARYGVFYLALIPACSTIDYLAGHAIQSSTNHLLRRLFLGISLLTNLSLLLLSRHMNVFPQPSGWDWIFPLSLSFYVFQSLSYTIDIYRKDGVAASSYLGYLASAAFFPTIQAGPITRPAEIFKQITRPFHLTPADGSRALFLIVFGLAKKLLIADYLAGNLVNRIFDTPNLYTGMEVLVAVYVYSLELYYDFSGYTDIARGCGLLLGVRLPINFDRPYTAVNMADFWRRWHITFSDWLRDYLYFSLPGKRTRVWPYVNLVITMVLGGLWHGSTWPFAIWGLLHGAALAATRGWQAWRGRRPEGGWRSRAIRLFCTYQFVCLTWIFFRSPTAAVALDILKRIGSLSFSLQNVSMGVILVSLLGAAGQAVPKNWYDRAVNLFARTPVYVQAAAMALAVVAIQLLAGRGSAPFVYTRF